MIQPVRTIGIAASFVFASAGIAAAQRGGLPRLVTAPAPMSAGGVMGVPRAAGPTAPVARGLPRLTTRPGGFARGYAMGTAGYGGGVSRGTATTRHWQPGYTRWVGAGCVGGCWNSRPGGRFKHFYGSYVVGYPFWSVPYFYDYGASYVESTAESYASEAPGRAAAKLIVVGGGSSGGGDALTVETLGDSVRLSWLVAGRPAREVRLFVADSARRELAARSATPASPTAVFEVATLSAPVSFAGVSVTFADGVVTTTMVPYRQQR